MPHIKYTEKKFRKIGSAKKFAGEMKKDYGYKPTVFSVKPPEGKRFYAVVKPKGLKKLK